MRSALTFPSLAIFFSLIWFTLVNAVSDIEKNAEQPIKTTMATAYSSVASILYTRILSDILYDIFKP